MLSFHNDENIKNKYLERVRNHRLSGRIVKKFYWKDEKGSAVACTLQGYDLEDYEKELGIPQVLAWLEDIIFFYLPNDKAMLFPEEFLDAVPVGADLSKVWPRLAQWILKDKNFGVAQYIQERNPHAKELNDYIDFAHNIYNNGNVITEKEIKERTSKLFDTYKSSMEKTRKIKGEAAFGRNLAMTYGIDSAMSAARAKQLNWNSMLEARSAEASLGAARRASEQAEVGRIKSRPVSLKMMRKAWDAGSDNYCIAISNKLLEILRSSK